MRVELELSVLVRFVRAVMLADYSRYRRKEGHVFGLFKADVSVAVASLVCNHVQLKRERESAGPEVDFSEDVG